MEKAIKLIDMGGEEWKKDTYHRVYLRKVAEGTVYVQKMRAKDNELSNKVRSLLNQTIRTIYYDIVLGMFRVGMPTRYDSDLHFFKEIVKELEEKINL